MVKECVTTHIHCRLAATEELHFEWIRFIDRETGSIPQNVV